MIRHGRIVCAIVLNHVIFPMWMAKLSHGSCWPRMYVVWASFKNHYCVDL
jgi:hypothetical protein